MQLKKITDEQPSAPPDIEELTSQYTRILRLFAILPLKGRDYDFLPTRCLLCYCVTSSIINFGMFATYGIIRLKQGVVELDFVCEYMVVIGYISRFFILVGTRGRFLELDENLRELWKVCSERERRIVQEFVRKMQVAFKCCVVVATFLTVLYSSTAFVARLPPIRPNGTETRTLPFRFFVDGFEPSAGWAGLFVLQMIILQMDLMILVGIDTAIPFVIMFACGYLRILQDRLLLLENKHDKPKQSEGTTFDREVHEQLVGCTKFHISVLQMCDKIKIFTGTLFLVQLLCTGYNLSLAGIQLAGKDPDRYKFISIFGLCFVELFVCQWTPDFLLEESEAVSTAAYFAALSSLNPRNGKMIMLIMERARSPVRLTAGGVVYMSIESFGSILTSAFSFFTILRRFNA